MTKVLADHGANITYVDIHGGPSHSNTYFELTLEGVGVDTILADLRQVPGVTNAVA